jgi:hypothetical protein
MEALGMVYPQYWLTGDCKENFGKHIEVIKMHYYQPKSTQRNTKPKKRSKKGPATNASSNVHQLSVDNADDGTTPLQVCPLTIVNMLINHDC